ncbi:reverse transcriptase domain-containing protein [Tanacetum coccineum]
MTDKYCPLDEIQKLEIELWNLKVKGNDVPAYTEHFQELTLICTKFCANETEKINKYIRGLPDNIYGNVKSSKPNMLYETIELANDLMDQKLRTYAEKSDNKRKADDSSRNNHGHQQQPFKKHNVAKVYNMGTGEKKPYEGNLPKSTGNTNVANTQKGNGAAPKGNVGNAKKRGNASGNPDSNVVTVLINIAPTPLENCYDVELADGKYSTRRQELGSFDVIIGMDWLRRCHAVIVCDEKLVQVSYRNETLTFCGNKSSNGRESRLTVISCSKAQEYMEKGCQNKKEHEEHLKEILELLKKEQLYAKFSKCEFWISKVQFLGHVINSRGIHVDPAKIESIKDWESPKTPMEIR